MASGGEARADKRNRIANILIAVLVVCFGGVIYLVVSAGAFSFGGSGKGSSGAVVGDPGTDPGFTLLDDQICFDRKQRYMNVSETLHEVRSDPSVKKSAAGYSQSQLVGFWYGCG